MKCAKRRRTQRLPTSKPAFLYTNTIRYEYNVLHYDTASALGS